ncbi:GumC family protein [Chthonobacter rhizosphaerae]|uniref:GumC family protein n=1 Tax=Chthonobacter rhizosphaerae TaxID=2735553 RepID=UPI0015EFB02D|nr:exopolysaccharide transport family protein [Chthonobacter rhizosphaerae]
MIGSTDGRPEFEDDVALDLPGVLKAVWRRRLMVALTTAVFGLGTFATLSVTPPSYRAETKILVENREVDLRRDGSAVPDKAVIDKETVASQVQLLTSRDLVRRVAEKHRLAERDEFDGTRPSLVSRALVAVGLGSDPMRVSPEERVLDAFMEHTEVYQVDGSRVLVIRFASEDRALAADVANSIAEEYMALQGEAKRRTSEDQTRWLGEEIERLRVKVREAEEGIEAYRTGKDLFVGENNATLTRQQITDLTNSLSAARAAKAEADSRARQLKSLLDRQSSLDNAADVLDSDTYRSLRAREIALRNRLSELSVTLLPGHPQVRAVQSQIADITVQQTAEARRVLASLQNDARIADARVASLTTELDALKGASAVDAESEVQLRALEREAASQRDLLSGLLVRYREAVARQGAAVLPADARVISRASMPAEPTFPKVGPLTLMATVAGFLLAIAWIVTGEFLGGRALRRIPVNVGGPISREAAAEAIRDLEAASREPGAHAPETAPAFHPVEVPEVVPDPLVISAADLEPTDDPRVMRFRAAVGRAAAARAPHRARSHEPAGPDAADLHTVLVSEGTSRVVVTGATSADAVERVVADFARLATAEGARVVVVDTVPGHAGADGPGLSDLITGASAFDDIIRRNPLTRAHEIGVGTRPLHPEELAGEEIDTVLTALAHTYDVVVLDLGLIEPDPLWFSLIATADHTILVGDATDPDVLRIHDLMVEGGIAPVSIIPLSDATLHAAA